MFSKLFKLEWESGDASGLCQMITATLQDYWRDIEEWLPEYFFSKFVKECMTVVISQYCMCLRRYPPGSLTFTGELTAARRMFEDMETLGNFFTVNMDKLRKGGIRPNPNDPSGQQALAYELNPISQLARIISATHISGAEEEVNSLYDRWGADGLQLVQCAISSNPSMDKNDKADNLEVAEKMFNKKKYSADQQCDLYRTVVGSLIGGGTDKSKKMTTGWMATTSGRSSKEESVSALSISKWRTFAGKNKEKK